MSVEPALVPPILWPHCALHEDVPAHASCDRCGVFHCEPCVAQIGTRLICRRCTNSVHELDRDLDAEGHIRAIAHFNILVACGSVTLGLLLLNTPAYLTATGLPIVLAGMFFGAIAPSWLAINLLRGWPTGRLLQILLSFGLAAAGTYAFFNLEADLRIQGFMFADYNLAILWVLLGRSGAACFTPAYRELVALDRRRSTLSPLYLLFLCWAVLTFSMLSRSKFFR